MAAPWADLLGPINGPDPQQDSHRLTDAIERARRVQAVRQVDMCLVFSRATRRLDAHVDFAGLADIPPLWHWVDLYGTTGAPGVLQPAGFLDRTFEGA